MLPPLYQSYEARSDIAPGGTASPGPGAGARPPPRLRARAGASKPRFPPATLSPKPLALRKEEGRGAFPDDLVGPGWPRQARSGVTPARPGSPLLTGVGLSERGEASASNPHPQQPSPPTPLPEYLRRARGFRLAAMCVRCGLRAPDAGLACAARLPSPCAQGEGLGVRVLRPQPSLGLHTSPAPAYRRASNAPGSGTKPPPAAPGRPRRPGAAARRR